MICIIKECEREATSLCDMPMTPDNAELCDVPLCAVHVAHVFSFAEGSWQDEAGFDLCPVHAVADEAYVEAVAS